MGRESGAHGAGDKTDAAGDKEAALQGQSDTAYVDDGVIIDPVFGRIEEGGPQYRNVGWIRTAVLLMKTQIGIGALGIPLTFGVLGMVPGVVILAVIGGMTTWSEYTIGHFKLRHPECYSIDDVGALIFGKVGREVFILAFQVYFLFVAGSAFITVSTALNALSDHGACTAIFVAVAAIAAWLLSSIRTLSRLSWLAWIGLCSALVSLLTLVIAVSLQDRPASAPQTGPWESDFRVATNPTFPQAMSAVGSIVFAFSGTPAFLPIISEMRNPRDCFKSIFLCQATVFTVYLIVGVIVYYYCGTYVTSPALGSAGALMKKVCYGLALPSLLVSSMLVCHLPAKNAFVRILRNSHHLTANTATHWITWLSCTFCVIIIGYIIASAIPGFSALVSLIGALLGTLISLQPYGAMWIYENWNSDRKTRGSRLRWTFGLAWAIWMIVGGTFLMVGGTYGAVLDIISIYNASGGNAAWSCADNSSS